MIKLVPLLWRVIQTGKSLCYAEEPRAKCSTPAQVGLTRSELRGRILSLCLLPTLLWLQPRISLGFWALNAHCQATMSISANIPKSFFSRLLPTHSLSSRTCVWDYYDPGSGPCIGLVELQSVLFTI